MVVHKREAEKEGVVVCTCISAYNSHHSTHNVNEGKTAIWMNRCVNPCAAHMDQKHVPNSDCSG